MRPLWAAARAAVRRRKLQTVVIALVIMLSTTTLIFGLSLLQAANAPFDDAFAAARGAHDTAAFDPAKATDDQLLATARAPGVTAAAGPFPTAVLPRMSTSDLHRGIDEGALLVGRADPGGPVDRLSIVAGRWVRSPGEIVVQGGTAARALVGRRLVPSAKGLPTLTVVGVASSATQTAGGWVVPGQVAAFNSTGRQMLYRFAGTGSESRISQELATATAGLPKGALSGNESYLTAKRNFQKGLDQILPFVTVFGILGAIVSIMIIANVVSGAVVSGYRHIGIMKAIGFTPSQVTGVYVAMIAIPGLIGCLFGVVFGDLMGAAIVRSVKRDFSLPGSSGISLRLNALAVLGVVAVLGVTALIPALRAGRLSAVRAISTSGGSRGGRGRGVQRWLARTSLPSPVSLGLSLPFARPGRTALTLAAIALGAMAAAFGVGLHNSVVKITHSTHDEGQVQAFLPPPGGSDGPDVKGQGGPPVADPAAVARADQILRSVPGTAAVAADFSTRVHVTGVVTVMNLEVYRGDSEPLRGTQLGRGRWFHSPGEVLASEGFLRGHHHQLGDTIQLEYGGHRTTVRIVGSLFHPADDRLVADWSTASAIAAGTPSMFIIKLRPGTPVESYLTAAKRAAAGTGLDFLATGSGGDVIVFDALFFTFTLILCLSAALGVLNTVVLNTRERARDLGVLKSIGMTPRQVVAMVLTSMAALGLVGGLVGVPLGVLAHHGVLTYTGRLIQAGMPGRFVTVYGLVPYLLLGLSGPAIGVIGALLPAGWAARMKTAPVLRSE